MFLPEGCFDCLLEYLHVDAADILTQPLIKNRAEKVTESFSRYRAIAYAAPIIPSRLHRLIFVVSSLRSAVSGACAAPSNSEAGWSHPLELASLVPASGYPLAGVRYRLGAPSNATW